MLTKAITLTAARSMHSTENTMLQFMATTNKTEHVPLGRCCLHKTSLFGIGSRGGPVLLESRKEKYL